jgi:hypothetical protein
VIRAILIAALLAFAASSGAQPQDRHAALERAYGEFIAARAALGQAEEAREKGIEPLAGERVGIAGGGSRLSEAYWSRQEQLDKAVLGARKRLDESLARWRDLR